MAQKSIWDNFTRQYKLSKTLRFELKPYGRTEEHIKNKGIISSQWSNGENVLSGEDADKAKNYKRIKKLFNKMHQSFIKEALEYQNVKKTIRRSNYTL